MELQFEKQICPCMQKVMSRPVEQELTQELRLPDAMPDIGRVLGCWGQVLIRGKEWRQGSAGINGGVLLWVLYATEDGSENRAAESWIPFQMKWDLPETKRDGFICVLPFLKSADARSISARKLMLRGVVSILGEALEPAEVETFSAGTVPDDVQILTQSYPVELPLEAGEKSFQIEEELSVSDFGKIVHYEIFPQITEQKIMASRLVFRGFSKIHMLYTDDNGKLHTWDGELPFAQYSDLDREYGSNAVAWISPIVNGVELEKTENGKNLFRNALTAQYVIYDRKNIALVEDAFSPIRDISKATQDLRLPIRLDSQMKTYECSRTVPFDGHDVVEVSANFGYPTVRQNTDLVQIQIPANYQLLWKDDAGCIQSTTEKGEFTFEVSSDAENQLDVYPVVTSVPSISMSADGMVVTGTLETAVNANSGNTMEMVTALEFGEKKEPDPLRPSLILRRAGDQRLWDIAKECGTTVDAIRTANQLQQEPMANQILLIPVN